MATDFNTEFLRIWGGSTTCSISGWDWNSSVAFDSTDSASCYSAEADLISSLTSEAYSTYGFEVVYYIKQISTRRNRPLGEDPLENVIRRFRLDVYTTETPTLGKTYQLQGMTYDEVVEIYATIAHFSEASQYTYDRSSAPYDIYTPKIGDLMYFPYCDRYYQVVNVKKFAEETSFLGSPITYSFILRIWRNSHEDVDIASANSDTMDEFREYAYLATSFNLPNQSRVDSSADILSINRGGGAEQSDPFSWGELRPKKK